MGSILDKRTSLLWASAICEAKDYIIVDFQTTDLASNGGEICQLAALDHSGNMLMDRLIQPYSGKVSPGAFKIHGLSDKQLSQYPLFSWMCDEFQDLIQDKLIISWGKQFDLDILRNTQPDVNWRNYEWECLMDRFAPIAGNYDEYHQSWTWVKLLDACGMIKVQGRDPGSAMGNCLMSFDVLQWMASLGRRLE